MKPRSMGMKFLLFITILSHHVYQATSMAILSSSYRNSIVVTGCFDGPEIFLTVSSLAKTKRGVLQDRLIEVNWNNIENENGDWIGLFDSDPEKNPEVQPLERIPLIVERSSIKTEFRLDRLPLSQNNVHLGYWVALFKNDQINLTNSLKIYPTWMRDHKDIIGDMPLYSMMIPGTHNSGSWREYDGPNSDTVFVRYLVNQDESVYRQLMHGIRYLDIRVGFYANSAEKFWINHNFYRMGPLSELVADVKKFVEETKEVVILDFHRFPVGFDGRRDRHAQLVDYLNTELGQYAVPSSLWPNATPNEIWSSNKSVIISYADSKTAQQFNYLWPPLPQEWGDKRSLSELKEFLGDSLKKRGGKGQIWAAMAEFTPKPLDVVLRPNLGLRPMAQTVNLPMTYWIQDKSWYPKANVIATDFFLGNNIIQTSIKSNLRSIKCLPTSLPLQQ